MAKMVMSLETLQSLLQQAKTTGNTQLAAQLEEAIKAADRLPETFTLADAVEASKEGRLTIREHMLKEAARLLVHLATCVASASMQERILEVLTMTMEEEQR